MAYTPPSSANEYIYTFIRPFQYRLKLITDDRRILPGRGYFH